MAALTIKDIALICGVSISTVSRAINDDPGINANTRARVMEVVKEFNYIPNNSARNLKMTESNTVALIVKGLNNPFFQGMFPLFQEALEREGYQFLLHTVRADSDESYVAEEIAKEKRLKGIIFLGGKMDYPEKVLENIRIPLVLCSVAGRSGSDEEKILVSSVSIDDPKEAYKVVDYLCKNGHKRIAIVTGQKSDSTVGPLRLQGYKQALLDNGIEYDESLVGYMGDNPEYSEANGYCIMEQLLKNGGDFTAVFVISDRMAVGVYKAIYDAGKRIPEDYSVIGFDGIELTHYMQPSLTTVVQPVQQMVDSSIKMLMEQIEDSSVRQRRTYEAELHERDSVLNLYTGKNARLK